MDDVTLNGLLRDLASPDPVTRDEKAYSQLARAIMARELTTAQRSEAARVARELLQHREIQARTFGPLILAVLVDVGDWDDAWFAETRDWYVAETDLRGYDDELGWLHAVAHGSDFFGEAAVAGRVPGDEVLDVLVERCVTATPLVWQDQEEIRVAHAAAHALSDPRLAPHVAVGWLERVESELEALKPGPPPPWSTNTLHMLHALHVALGHEILHDGEPVTIRHGDRVRARVAATIQPTQPWFWRTR
ncbi:DUF2785 domain-containing protein [Luteipulveratus mongoliensis]|uniref:DUF2785 domain-containing protein n=1 Tax=Luteipulveratus mongoliensis TaxID=571913 RepID=A0A0K1JK17_9MICO|nr:DUF2785 domain-containing protein [Luteipulveratus mongoliensis]AKU17062.1 hypothetical protein VV02_16305 [Luteipulveratus mongoliensis]